MSLLLTLQKEPESENKENDISAPESTRKRTAKKSSFDDLLQLAEKQLRTEDDRYDILGKSIASKMRDIQCSDQELYAEHMIDEVLFQARLGTLQSSTCLDNFKCFKCLNLRVVLLLCRCCLL